MTCRRMMAEPIHWVLLFLLAVATPESSCTRCRGDAALRVSVFDVDASPPVGSPLAYDPTQGVLIPLSCRGVVLLPAGQQAIVLCAVDWIGIGNEGQRAFRAALAEAAGTVPRRVVVHALHQHDAPNCDFSADQLLAQHGLQGQFYDSVFARQVIRRAADAIRAGRASAEPVTHCSLSEATVEKVASNRRILGPDGTVQHTRWTATRDAAIRALPVGTIDPLLKMIGLWQGDRRLVVLTYYATHPQSYYRTGLANPDFPGIARNLRQEATGVTHIHFNGAGGNIGAGKWNDGSPGNRQVLAERMAKAMALAWERSRRIPLTEEAIGWQTAEVRLPAAEHLDERRLRRVLENDQSTLAEKTSAASHLVWLRRCLAGDPIDVACLRLGQARVLHLPGELFVEYQLAAQRMQPDLFVALAAYGDYAPGYIGTSESYAQGGYETSARASRVAPEVEGVLLECIANLLQAGAEP